MNWLHFVFNDDDAGVTYYIMTVGVPGVYQDNVLSAIHKT